MIHDRHTRFLNSSPERIKARVARRLQTFIGSNWSGPDKNNARIAIKRPLKFGHCIVNIRQHDVRSREDAVLVCESPVLVEPAIEGTECSLCSRKVITECLFHSNCKCWEEQRAFDVQAVHRLQTDFTISVRRIARKQLTKEILDAVALWIAAAEILLKAARRRKHVERRVRDEPIDLAANKQHLATIHFGPLHTAALELRLDVAGERVHRLVVVIVGVEHRGDLGHCSPSVDLPRIPRGDSPTVANLHPLSHLR